jgi:hypothetical protein
VSSNVSVAPPTPGNGRRSYSKTSRRAAAEAVEAGQLGYAAIVAFRPS